MSRTRSVVGLPDFVIIGGAKCGSTALFEYLRRDPRLQFPVRRDTNFFSHPEIFRRGREHYRSLLPEKREGVLVGEDSPTYSRVPLFLGVPARMAEYNPEVKIIYLVREPVSRVISHYFHISRAAGGPIGLRALLSADPSVVFASDYAMQIEEYLKVFRNDQIHVCFQEDLKRDPFGVVASVRSFLGLEPVDGAGFSPLIANSGIQNDARNATTQRLLSVFPFARRAAGWVPLNVRRRVAEFLSGFASVPAPNLTPDDCAVLVEVKDALRGSTERLEQILGIRVPACWGDEFQTG